MIAHIYIEFKRFEKIVYKLENYVVLSTCSKFHHEFNTDLRHYRWRYLFRSFSFSCVVYDLDRNTKSYLFLIFKYLMYSLLWKRHDLIDSLNRKRFLLIIVYWFEIAACNLANVNTLAQAETKTDIFSTIHLISFVFVNRLSFAVDILELSLRTYLKLHSSLDFMTFAQTLIHIVIFLSRNSLHFKKSFQFYELLMNCSLSSSEHAMTKRQTDIAFISLLILTWIRHYFYELFLKSHFFLLFSFFSRYEDI